MLYIVYQGFPWWVYATKEINMWHVIDYFTNTGNTCIHISSYVWIVLIIEAIYWWDVVFNFKTFYEWNK